MSSTERQVQRVGVRELRPGPSSPLARLIAEGRIVPARRDLTEFGPPPGQPREMTISEALAAQREER
ncbi:MAG TPA: hypothetical protein VIA62_08945 [Thermoanaerobaculia bacterium]|jgi:hypothetical protein|nr:hypothetical protein [Thermoanaerobaculia bacterium]